MKKLFFYLILALLVINLLKYFIPKPGEHCLIGAFLADQPRAETIVDFQNKYGKKPYLVMSFVDWDNYPDFETIADIYSQECMLLLTWEPWRASAGEGIDYDGLLTGKYDRYIKEFAARLCSIGKPVLLRFAHEPNGNWYPWSGQKISSDKYIKMYRHVRDIFDSNKCKNVKWIFCVNWEDVPEKNNYFLKYYPGSNYVDYVGLDGYNWGSTQPWSRWVTFKDIFSVRYAEALMLKKPVLITEFGSASAGGDKAHWIKDALSYMKNMGEVKGFVIFNVNKEADWSFSGNKDWEGAFRQALDDPYFTDRK